MSRGRMWLGALALVLGGAVSTPSLAQESVEDPADVARAKELAMQSRELYAQARYEEAAAALQQAYELAPRPQLLFNMASPLERLGRWDEALDALKRYRPDAEPGEYDAIDRRITALELKVSQERADREAVQNSQQPVVVVKERKGPPAGAYALIGLGVAGLGSGTVFTVRALGARNEWTGQCVEDTLICPAGASEAADRDRTSSLIADVSWIVGVGATGAGLAIALGGKKKKKPDAETASVQLQVLPQHVGLTVVPGLSHRSRGGAR